MKYTLKTTNFKIDEALKVYVDSKIPKIVEKFFKGRNTLVSASLDVEIEKTTRHHHKGRIWRAEVNLGLPGAFLRAEADAEDVRAAIDLVEEELKSELKSYKEKHLSAVDRRERKMKREMKGR